MKTGPTVSPDPELKTYVTIHLPTVLSTFFESSHVTVQLKTTVRGGGREGGREGGGEGGRGGGGEGGRGGGREGGGRGGGREVREVREGERGGRGGMKGNKLDCLNA